MFTLRTFSNASDDNNTSCDRQDSHFSTTHSHHRCEIHVQMYALGRQSAHCCMYYIGRMHELFLDALLCNVKIYSVSLISTALRSPLSGDFSRAITPLEHVIHWAMRCIQDQHLYWLDGYLGFRWVLFHLTLHLVQAKQRYPGVKFANPMPGIEALIIETNLRIGSLF